MCMCHVSIHSTDYARKQNPIEELPRLCNTQSTLVIQSQAPPHSLVIGWDHNSSLKDQRQRFHEKKVKYKEDRVITHSLSSVERP